VEYALHSTGQVAFHMAGIGHLPNNRRAGPPHCTPTRTRTRKPSKIISSRFV